jgi:hypothetical protein
LSPFRGFDAVKKSGVRGTPLAGGPASGTGRGHAGALDVGVEGVTDPVAVVRGRGTVESSEPRESMSLSKLTVVP